jgi:hypothetical protein
MNLPSPRQRGEGFYRWSFSGRKWPLHLEIQAAGFADGDLDR